MRLGLSVTLVLGLLGCSRSQSARADADVVPLVPALEAGALAVRPALSAKAFGAPCETDAECAGTVCFHKRLKGSDPARERRGANDEPVERDGYCSIRCHEDADCPVPLTKGRCGARGMCKRPE